MEDPPYSIVTAEMTRECPDPFPAPTATKSQTARERPQNRSDKEKIACLSRTRRGFLVQGGHLVGERHAGKRPLQRCQLALAGVWHHEPGLRAAPDALADEGQAHLLAPELAQDLESPAAELFQIGLLETSGASEERSLGLREPALGAPPLN